MPVVRVSKETDYQAMVPVLAAQSATPVYTFGHKGTSEAQEVPPVLAGYRLVVITSDEEKYLPALEDRGDLIVLVWGFKESEASKDLERILNLVDKADEDEQKALAKIVGATSSSDLAVRLLKFSQQQQSEEKVRKFLNL